MFADFVFLERGDAAIWVDGAYVDTDFIERLTDGDLLFGESNCQIVKDQKKIKVARVTLTIAGQSRTIFVKRYNAFSLRYKLASPLIHSGAFRALRGAAILRAAEISTARPVAAVEHRRGGVLTKSFFLTEEIAGGETVDAYWRGRLRAVNGRAGIAPRRRFLIELARLFETLHRQRIYHNDLKDANIMAATDQANKPLKFFLLDLEGVKRYTRLSADRKVKNLVQLNRTLGRYVAASDKLFFLKGYLGPAFAERKVRRQWIEKVMSESSRLDDLKKRLASVSLGSKRGSHGR